MSRLDSAAAKPAAASCIPELLESADREVCLYCPTCAIGCAEAAARADAAVVEALAAETGRLLGDAPARAPRKCWHCERAACVDACPAGAMQRDREKGVVFVDRERCIGCWLCVLACPVGAVVPGPDGEHPVKCDGCREREHAACADLCAPRMRAVGGRLAASALEAAKRRALATAGWSWRGVDEFPAFREKPLREPAVVPASEPRRYAIVGAGIAAALAVEAIRERDSRGSIVVVSDERYQPYSRVLLPQFVTRRKDAATMAIRAADWWQRQGVELVLGDGAVGLDPEAHNVTLASGRSIAYDRLLLACGAAPGGLPTPGADLEGVVSFHRLSDAEAMRRAAAKRAVVVGAGFVAVKAAECLRETGADVSLVVRSRLLRRTLDDGATRLVAERLEAKGVRLVTGAGLREVTGVAGRATGVTLTDGRHLPCDLVVSAAGVQPHVAWLAGIGLAVDRGVVVDAWLRTNLPDVWAAGDVAQTRDLLAGEAVVNAVWPAAAAQGRLAGAAMAGDARPYDGSLALNTLDIFGLPVASFGELDGEPVNLANGTYARAYYRDRRLVGAVLVGDIDNAGLLLAEATRQALNERSTNSTRRG